jgi:hypothetical protein
VASGEVVLAVVGVGGTLAAGTLPQVLQGRREQQTWLRDKQYDIRVRAVSDALRRARAFELQQKPPEPHDGPGYQPFAARLDEDGLVALQAEIAILGDPRLAAAWDRYVGEIIGAQAQENDDTRSAADVGRLHAACRDVVAAGNRWTGSGYSPWRRMRTRRWARRIGEAPAVAERPAQP